VVCRAARSRARVGEPVRARGRDAVRKRQVAKGHAAQAALRPATGDVDDSGNKKFVWKHAADGRIVRGQGRSKSLPRHPQDVAFTLQCLGHDRPVLRGENEGEFRPAQFEVDAPPLPGSTNLAIRPRGSKSPGEATANAIVTIAPPLVFHTRMSMFHLDEINTVAQSFRADVYIEYRLRGITSDPDEGLVKALFHAYGFREDMLELIMAIDVISMERWSSISQSSTVPNTYDYALRLRARAIFAEQYELAEFPFDVQDMHITTTLNIPKIRATLIENLEFPSIMMHRTFQHKSVFDIVYGEVLSVEMTTSDPSESGAGYIYPRCTFITTLSRHHGYYITNVLLPMMVIT